MYSVRHLQFVAVSDVAVEIKEGPFGYNVRNILAGKQRRWLQKDRYFLSPTAWGHSHWMLRKDLLSVVELLDFSGFQLYEPEGISDYPGRSMAEVPELKMDVDWNLALGVTRNESIHSDAIKHQPGSLNTDQGVCVRLGNVGLLFEHLKSFQRDVGCSNGDDGHGQLEPIWVNHLLFHLARISMGTALLFLGCFLTYRYNGYRWAALQFSLMIAGVLMLFPHLVVKYQRPCDESQTGASWPDSGYAFSDGTPRISDNRNAGFSVRVSSWASGKALSSTL